jgi:hypothetical protein
VGAAASISAAPAAPAHQAFSSSAAAAASSWPSAHQAWNSAAATAASSWPSAHQAFSSAAAAPAIFTIGSAANDAIGSAVAAADSSSEVATAASSSAVAKPTAAASSSAVAAAAATSASSSEVATVASSSAVAAAASSSWAAAVAEYPVPSEEALAGAGAMLRRSEASGRMGANIGSLEFVAFCSIHKRRLMMLMPDGEIDIAMAFAATLLDETWTLVPFARLVVPVARGGGHWCMCSYAEATHFMAAVPAERRQVEGVSAFAEGARKGYHILTTVADGNCGPDALLAVANMPRNRVAMHGLRLQIRGVLFANAGSPVWHGIAAACQEMPAAPVAKSAVARPSAAEPAVAGSSVAEPAAAGPSAAELAVAGLSAAEPAAAGPSAAKLAVARPLAAEPVVPTAASSSAVTTAATAVPAASVNEAKSFAAPRNGPIMEIIRLGPQFLHAPVTGSAVAATASSSSAPTAAAIEAISLAAATAANAASSSAAAARQTRNR